jgi:hypothetical protein
MKKKPRSRSKHKNAKSVLRLPDLEHAKAAVFNSLTFMLGGAPEAHEVLSNMPRIDVQDHGQLSARGISDQG